MISSGFYQPNTILTKHPAHLPHSFLIRFPSSYASQPPFIPHSFSKTNPPLERLSAQLPDIESRIKPNPLRAIRPPIRYNCKVVCSKGNLMDIGIIQPVDIDEQMRTAYLDYAMSVIVERALPDARRWSPSPSTAASYTPCRIWASAPTPAYKKSPHRRWKFSASTTPTAIRPCMKPWRAWPQDFSMRYPLVDGQGKLWLNRRRRARCHALHGSPPEPHVRAAPG